MSAGRARAIKTLVDPRGESIRAIRSLE
jgi:hypothetical protein